MDRAIKMDETNVNFLMNRSACYYDLDEHEKSISDLKQALKISPNDPQIYYKLGLSYYANEKYKKAIKVFRSALDNKPYLTYEADLYYHIGLAYCNQEKFEKAIFPFSKCIELVKCDIRYIHERAKAYQMINEHEKAIEDFDSVI